MQSSTSSIAGHDNNFFYCRALPNPAVGAIGDQILQRRRLTQFQTLASTNTSSLNIHITYVFNERYTRYSWRAALAKAPLFPLDGEIEIRQFAKRAGRHKGEKHWKNGHERKSQYCVYVSAESRLWKRGMKRKRARRKRARGRESKRKI